MGTVWERYGKRLELLFGIGMGSLGLVYGSGMGAVLKRRYGIWCKALTAERSPMKALATYFSKSKFMARFQSHQGIRFHKKEDLIGDLEIPDDVLDLLFFRRK